MFTEKLLKIVLTSTKMKDEMCFLKWEKKTWLLNCLNVLLCVCYNVDKEGGREEIDSELSANGSPFVLTVVCAQINIFGIF